MSAGDPSPDLRGTEAPPGCPAVSVGQALSWAREALLEGGVESADLDGRVLLGDLLGWDQSRLISGRDERLPLRCWSGYRAAVDRRRSRIPLAHLRGVKEFWSLDFAVDDRVLVPRPETEGVVEAALEVLGGEARVVDVGTGSGNIIVSLAGEVGGEGWYALDISPEAIEVACRNVQKHGLGGRISLAVSDLLETVREMGGRFDAVLSNPPYIPTGDLEGLEPEVRLHEPRIALDGGPDGMEVLRRLVTEAPHSLLPGGRLIAEFGDGQAAQAAEEARATGLYRSISTRRDLAGRERILIAERR